MAFLKTKTMTLFEKIYQSELAFKHPKSFFFGFFIINNFLKILHKADDIAKSEYP